MIVQEATSRTPLRRMLLAFALWHRNQGATGSLFVPRIGLTREQALAHDLLDTDGKAELEACRFLRWTRLFADGSSPTLTHPSRTVVEAEAEMRSETLRLISGSKRRSRSSLDTTKPIPPIQARTGRGRGRTQCHWTKKANRWLCLLHIALEYRASDDASFFPVMPANSNAVGAKKARKKPKAPQVIAPEVWVAIEKACCAGLGYSAAAREFGVSVFAVMARSERNKWPVGNRIQRRVEALQEACYKARERYKPYEQQRNSNAQVTEAIAESWTEKGEAHRSLVYGMTTPRSKR